MQMTLKFQRYSGDVPAMEMNSHRPMLVWLTASACLTLAACSSNSAVPSPGTAMVSVTVGQDFDPTEIMPGQTVPIVATVKNVYLVAPDTTPPAAHVADAGYLQVYLDDDSTGSPMLVTAQTSFDVTIPEETTIGSHQVLCRIYKHDGTPTTAEATVGITVKSPSTGQPDSGQTGQPDAGQTGQPDAGQTGQPDAGTGSEGGSTCTTAATGEITCTSGDTTCVTNATGTTKTCTTGDTTCTMPAGNTATGTTTCTTGNTTCTMPTGSTPTGDQSCTTSGSVTTCTKGSQICVTTAP